MGNLNESGLAGTPDPGTVVAGPGSGVSSGSVTQVFPGGNAVIRGDDGGGIFFGAAPKGPCLLQIFLLSVNFYKMSGRLSRPKDLFPDWLTAWMADRGLTQFGAADLQGFTTPKDRAGAGFPRALAFLVPMSPRIMAAINMAPPRPRRTSMTG